MILGAGVESTFLTDIAFWVIATSSIIAAVAVVQLRDLFRAALFLVVSFIGVAGLFVLLRAEFLAVVQVLIYVGAISVLILFAILMTRDVKQGSPSNRLRIPAGILALLFLTATVFVVSNTDWNLIDDVIQQTDVSSPIVETDGGMLASETVMRITEIYSNTIPTIAELLLRNFVLAFEVASVLLLAAIIGALVLIRER